MEREEIVKTKQANEKVLNNFFSNIIKNLKIPESNQTDLICQNIKDLRIKAIIKYRNHPIIIAIKERCTNSKFGVSLIEKSEISKEFIC